MQPRSIVLGLFLVSLTVSAVPSLYAYAQAPSPFSFTLPAGSLSLCWFFGVSFGATQGQQLAVQWSENPGDVGPVSLDFYIVPEVSLHQPWLCDQGPVYLYWNDGAYGTANWAAPWTGSYAVLVVNYSYYPVSGMISVTAPNSSLPMNTIGPASVRRGGYCLAQCNEGPP